MNASYHEVFDPEAELINQQQRKVDHLLSFLRATGRKLHQSATIIIQIALKLPEKWYIVLIDG